MHGWCPRALGSFVAAASSQRETIGRASPAFLIVGARRTVHDASLLQRGQQHCAVQPCSPNKVGPCPPDTKRAAGCNVLLCAYSDVNNHARLRGGALCGSQYFSYRLCDKRRFSLAFCLAARAASLRVPTVRSNLTGAPFRPQRVLLFVKGADRRDHARRHSCISLLIGLTIAVLDRLPPMRASAALEAGVCVCVRVRAFGNQ